MKFSQRAAGWLSSLKEMQWLWAAIIVPIGTLAIAWWRRKKRHVKFSQRAAGWLSSLKEMQWLWAAIIVPIGTLAIAWWRRKKRRHSPRVLCRQLKLNRYYELLRSPGESPRADPRFFDMAWRFS